MIRFIIKLLLSAVAVIITAELLPGVRVTDYTDALWVAVALSILNAILKPILIILTIPVTLFTFGIFLLFINGFIIIMADSLIDGFEVATIWWAILFSLIVSIINSVFQQFILKEEKEER